MFRGGAGARALRAAARAAAAGGGVVGAMGDADRAGGAAGYAKKVADGRNASADPQPLDVRRRRGARPKVGAHARIMWDANPMGTACS